MGVSLTKVAGGYQVVIPADIAEAAGLPAADDLVVQYFAERIEVFSPEFVRQHREAMYARITPETLHGPSEPYPWPPELEADSEGVS